MAYNNITQPEFQPQKVFSFPVIKLSLELYHILLKVAAFKGIPFEDFAESELRKTALKNWDFPEHRPVGECENELI